MNSRMNDRCRVLSVAALLVFVSLGAKGDAEKEESKYITPSRGVGGPYKFGPDGLPVLPEGGKGSKKAEAKEKKRKAEAPRRKATYDCSNCHY